MFLAPHQTAKLFCDGGTSFATDNLVHVFHISFFLFNHLAPVVTKQGTCENAQNTPQSKHERKQNTKYTRTDTGEDTGPLRRGEKIKMKHLHATRKKKKENKDKKSAIIPPASTLRIVALEFSPAAVLIVLLDHLGVV